MIRMPTASVAKPRIADSVNPHTVVVATSTAITGANAATISCATASLLPPINWYRFFFQPPHIARNDRYIRTRTIPFPLPNQIQ